MTEFEEEYRVLSTKEQLQNILVTHKQNMEQLKVRLKLVGNSNKVLNPDISTLESDIEIFKHLIEEL